MFERVGLGKGERKLFCDQQLGLCRRHSLQSVYSCVYVSLMYQSVTGLIPLSLLFLAVQILYELHRPELG